MLTNGEASMKRWACRVTLSQELNFASVVARDLFYRFSRPRDNFRLEKVKPDVFPGEGLSEEAIDRQYTYLFTFFSDKDRAAIRAMIAQILQGVTAIQTVRLGEAPKPIVVRPKHEAQRSTEVVPPAAQRKAQGSMRVDLEKIEELVNLIGELIINKNQVDALSGTLMSDELMNAELKQQVAGFQVAKGQLHYVTGKLRDLALGIRMVPIGQTLRKFPAAVREMARKTGKKVNLITDGESTELDKAILEEIADPLLHIVRNAVDHGIEEPAARIKNGKIEEGTVLIRAEHEGDRISIFVEDDGGGLNEEKILQKAVAKGIVGGKESKQMTQREIHQLIFSPGFSTADTVSELSGRGVGMDVVKNNIMRLNGVVEVESGKNIGTRITLKLPLTLSILEGLLLEDMGQTYAIPLIAIEKAYLIDARRLKKVGRYALIEKDNQTIPVFRLGELFGLRERQEQTAYYLIEASSTDGRFGLMVQKIIGRQEIVLKPLGDYLGKVVGVSGATILGNGHVTLILDTKTISESLHGIIRETAATQPNTKAG